MVPGGLFLASVHGEFAAEFVSATIGNDMRQYGISDMMRDRNLDGVAPKDYYRGVFQTRSYTYREWSKYFTIIDYIEGGISNYQDLVVMKKEK